MGSDAGIKLFTTESEANEWADENNQKILWGKPVEEGYRAMLKAADSESISSYTYTVMVGADLKKIKVDARNEKEAKSKIEKIASKLKFNGKSIPTKWD